MPRLESHLNHREFKLKLEILIKNWKKRSSAEKKQATLAISQGLRNFTTHAKFRKAVNFSNTCEISQGCEFSQLGNFGCSCC